MKIKEALEYIHSACWKGSVLGLSRTEELLARMKNPEKAMKYVHIAGTNGKGSIAAMTASILQKAGYRTGLYTSPCLCRLNEQMQVDGAEISDANLAEITEYVRHCAEGMEDSPTEFELICCIAFEFFRRKQCDIVILEAGMGGALDSTNVIEAPEVAVITRIGLDHTGYLGNTIEEIAAVKAGIVKEGAEAVIYPQSALVERIIKDVCQKRHVSLRRADTESLVLRSRSLDGQQFDCGDRKELFLPLLGAHQLKNAAVALCVAEVLKKRGWKVTEQSIRDGLRDVRWPGRFDVMSRSPLFIVDGGHNPQCMEALAENIRQYLPGRSIVALTGVLSDKDYMKMYQPVLPLIEQFVCITPPNPRGKEAEVLASYLRSIGAKATACPCVFQGVETAKRLAGMEGAVLCFGSLYSICEIQRALLS